MRIRDIEKVPVLFVNKGDCDKIVALALRAAMQESTADMLVVQRLISDNLEHISDDALQGIVAEIDKSPFKEQNGDAMTTICVRVLREIERRKYGE